MNSAPSWLRAIRMAAGCTLLVAAVIPAESADLRQLTASVVKIYVTSQREDYTQPWQSTMPLSGNGSGFIIPGRRILSNAHVVSDARFIEVQREGDPRKYPARVAMIGHDCDLAMLTVNDPNFFAGTKPLALGSALPTLNDQVQVVGYPLGGTRLSLTQGVVSRIDYGPYSHSGVDSHLVLQVDAAINPGNSGGPVLFKGRVIGVAFQGLAAAQSIGYAIPLPVIQHFLKDIEDGRYDGYPELGVSTIHLRNPALRADLKLTGQPGGVVVSFVDPFASAIGHLLPGDVLLAADGYPIAEDGTVSMDGTPVEFTELVERKQCGESVTFRVWRDGAAQEVTVPLEPVADPFAFRFQYDRPPEYVILGGLVFAPLTRNYLAALGSDFGSRAAQRLFYVAHYCKLDKLYQDREQFVVLIARLPAPVNTYADEFMNQIVTRANGLPVRRLEDLRAAFAAPTNGYHVIEFEGPNAKLILDAEEVRKAEPEIKRQYLGEPFRPVARATEVTP